MNKVIVFKNVNGGISVITPSTGYVEELKSIMSSAHPEIEDAQTIMHSVITFIAEKDVPTCAPYKIVDSAEVPIDRTFRDAWESDFTTYDGVGA